MRIAMSREREPGERRVSITPEVVTDYVAAGFEVQVESGAGVGAGYSDDAYLSKGATITDALDFHKVDVLTHVRPLDAARIGDLRPGTITIGLCSPFSELETVRQLRDASITSFALELVPRISRAQSMDALTSQALVAGYRCVIEAASRFPRFFPLYMTAAGTIPPARVLVLGAGVAGLQAIATAKRLGARVFANDVRAASADEVASMGATFITLDLDAADGQGGYAKELAEDRAIRQRDLLLPHVSDADVVITTAAIPGRPAPRLVTSAMLATMRPGSVVIDLAAESGGNVEGSRPGEDVSVPVPGGTMVIAGMKDIASTMPLDASKLYAKNIANLIQLMTKDGAVVPDFTDEIVTGACLTHAGEINNEPTATALAQLTTSEVK